MLAIVTFFDDDGNRINHCVGSVVTWDYSREAINTGVDTKGYVEYEPGPAKLCLTLNVDTTISSI